MLAFRFLLRSLLFVLLAAPAFAQEPLSVRGAILAADGKSPIAGAVVLIGTDRAVTANDGRFDLPAQAGTVRVTVNAAGFLTSQLDVVVSTTSPPLEIVMVPSPPMNEDVTVSADAVSAPSAPAALTVDPTAVLRVAGSGDNIFKALQTLPGVSGTDDFGSRLSVRGGGPDQNLTVMDGVEIHNPYRLFGLTSAFNPEIVDRFELTAGGFGPEYGDRLSSILVVDNRPGSTTDRLAGSATLSFTDANVVVEGKLPGKATGSWLVTGRRTYYDLIANKITNTDLPSFNDVQAKVVWELRPGHRVTFFGVRSRENTDAEFTESGGKIALGDLSKNDVAALTYDALLGRRASARTIVALYDYNDALDVDGSVRSDTQRTNVAEPADRPFSRVVFTRDLALRDVSLRQTVDAAVGRHQVISSGFDLHALTTGWGWVITGDRNQAAANGSSVIGGAGLPSLLRSTRRTARGAAWVQDRLAFGRWHVDGGLRLDHSGLSGEWIVSPRLAARFDLGSRTSLKAAVGRFSQSPGYEKLLQSDYFVDLTSPDATRLESERASHVLATLEHTITPALIVRVESYLKRFDRLIVGRLETPAETAARVAAFDFPAAFASSVPTAPIITSEPENGARGRAYGVDVYLEKRARAASDRLSGWLSYTWGRANVDGYGVTRPFDYDRRHAFSAVSTLALRPRIDLSTTVRVASGFPATLPVGVRVAAEPAADGSGRLVPAVDTDGATVWTIDFGGVSNLGRGRLPTYARVDLRLTFKPGGATGRWQIYLDVLNALNRKNVSNLQPQLEYDPSSDRPRVTYGTDSGLPLLPSFGIRYRF